MFETTDFIDLRNTSHGNWLGDKLKPWDVIRHIPDYMKQLLQGVDQCASTSHVHPRAIIEGDVYIGEGAQIDANVIIRGPVYIGRNCRIGANSFIRPNTILGDNAVVGYSCELKNCLILENSTVSHFCFVGDSLIGRGVNMGSCATTANFPHSMPMIDDGTTITVNYGEYGRIDTGLRHLGATIGDESRLGCHTVLNPGTIIGMKVQIHPNIELRGYIPGNSVVKRRSEIEIVPARSTITPKLRVVSPCP